MASFAGINAAVLSAFGRTAAWTRSTGGGPITITGIVAPPAMLENFPAASTQGVSVVRFWVDLNQIAQPWPAIGDTVLLGAVNYDVFDVNTDSANGSTLDLRRNA